jgi:hypothetical protein
VFEDRQIKTHKNTKHIFTEIDYVLNIISDGPSAKAYNNSGHVGKEH